MHFWQSLLENFRSKTKTMNYQIVSHQKVPPVHFECRFGKKQFEKLSLKIWKKKIVSESVENISLQKILWTRMGHVWQQSPQTCHLDAKKHESFWFFQWILIWKFLWQSNSSFDNSRHNNSLKLYIVLCFSLLFLKLFQCFSRRRSGEFPQHEPNHFRSKCEKKYRKS